MPSAAGVAPARVVRVPRIEEAACWAPPARSAPAPAKHTQEAAQPSEPLVFELEGFDEAEEVHEPITVSALQLHATIARLLAPTDSAPIHLAAHQAVQASGGDLQGTAAMLERMGWTVKMCSSPGGNLRQLRHTCLIATRHTYLHGEPSEWVIDPAFADAFAVTEPTPRYRHILSAVPPLVVAPLGRLLRVLLMLGAELERCFEKRGLPLPPWRSADALATRYERAAPATAAGPTTGGSSSGAVAAAARMQARTVQQLERVQLQLLKLGLEPAAAAAPPHSPTSSSSSGVDSPSAVTQASPDALSCPFHNNAKAPEWVCRGWQEPEQQQQQQGSGTRGHLAASAA